MRCLRPLDGEAGVEDAARVERAAVAVGEHRQRRDAVQARRLRGGDEQLADARVADADHADLVVEHPRLRGDGLDRRRSRRRSALVSKKRNDPPLQPVPRMFTPT